MPASEGQRGHTQRPRTAKPDPRPPRVCSLLTMPSAAPTCHLSVLTPPIPPFPRTRPSKRPHPILHLVTRQTHWPKLFMPRGKEILKYLANITDSDLGTSPEFVLGAGHFTNLMVVTRSRRGSQEQINKSTTWKPLWEPTLPLPGLHGKESGFCV